MTNQSICLTLLVCSTSAAILGLTAGAIWHQELYAMVAGDLATHLYISSNTEWLIQKALLAASSGVLGALLVVLMYGSWVRRTWPKRLFGFTNLVFWLGLSLLAAKELLEYKAGLVLKELQINGQLIGAGAGLDEMGVSFDVMPVYWLTLMPTLVLMVIWLIRRSRITRFEQRAAQDGDSALQSTAKTNSKFDLGLDPEFDSEYDADYGADYHADYDADHEAQSDGFLDSESNPKSSPESDASIKPDSGAKSKP